MLASGLILAAKGATWLHTSSLGHLVNSTHLWSVELFFACMVIPLWETSSWRPAGNRALTWVTGTLAFIGSIGTAFTCYLSQTNFDSQWTAGQAKDGLNSVGVGSEFNVLNTGQMLLWHVMLLPLILGILVVLHVSLVRRHGVVPPFGAMPQQPTPVRARGLKLMTVTRRGRRDDTPDAHRFPTRPYDLVKEFVVAGVVLGALTLKNWAQAAPNDVVATAAAELAGTSTSASYGAPYNRTASRLLPMIRQPSCSWRVRVRAETSSRVGTGALMAIRLWIDRAVGG